MLSTLLSLSGIRANNIRIKVCKGLVVLTGSLGNNILFFKEADKPLNQMSNYLSDACQDVRQTAKLAFYELNKQIMGKNDLERLLQRTLNENQYKKVKDLLDKEPMLGQQVNSGMAISQVPRPFGNTLSNGLLLKQTPVGKKPGIIRTATLTKK